jgi:hypothetical protein
MPLNVVLHPLLPRQQRLLPARRPRPQRRPRRAAATAAAGAAAATKRVEHDRARRHHAAQQHQLLLHLAQPVGLLRALRQLTLQHLPGQPSTSIVG